MEIVQRSKKQYWRAYDFLSTEQHWIVQLQKVQKKKIRELCDCVFFKFCGLRWLQYICAIFCVCLYMTNISNNRALGHSWQRPYVGLRFLRTRWAFWWLVWLLSISTYIANVHQISPPSTVLPLLKTLNSLDGDKSWWPQSWKTDTTYPQFRRRTIWPETSAHSAARWQSWTTCTLAIKMFGKYWIFSKHLNCQGTLFSW